MHRILPFLFLILLFGGSAPLLTAQSVGIELVYNWQNNDLPASSAFNNTYNEIWGFVQDGREYAVIGTTWGTHIFDLTDPDNIYQADSIAGAYQGAGVIHRDYHDYNGYLYMVCDEGTGISTLQIADLRYLPDSVQLVYDSNDLITKAHNIFIDSSSARLYTIATNFNPGYAGIGVFSLDNPEEPVTIGAYTETGQAHDAFVRRDTVFLNAGFEGLMVIDYTDASDPRLIGSLDSYTDQGYNHSGWLHDSKPIYVFADETPGKAIKVCDVSDLTDINELSTIFSGVDPNSMAHNLILRGDFLYISYYHDGFYFYDISDPADPVLLGFYDTYTPDDHLSYRGAWGVYPFLPSQLVLVSDMQSGLFVFRLDTLLSHTADVRTETAISLFPNPVYEQLFVQIDHPTAYPNALWEIFSVNGQRMDRGQLALTAGRGTYRISGIEELEAGAYILKIKTDGRWHHQKFVKIDMP